jgi:hypothetical protein
VLYDLILDSPQTDSISTANDTAEDPLSSLLTIHKIKDNPCSSSNSSIENSKPSVKLQKFEESSSSNTTISTQNEEIKTRDTSMELDNNSSLSSGTSKEVPVSMEDSPVESTNGSLKKLQLTTTMETLRWENELSDEEQERIRIEEYKLKRRQRYQEALANQRQLLLSKNNRKNSTVITK